MHKKYYDTVEGLVTERGNFNHEIAWAFIKGHARRTFIGGCASGILIGFMLGLIAVSIYVQMAILPAMGL